MVNVQVSMLGTHPIGSLSHGITGINACIFSKVALRSFPQRQLV